MSISTRQLTEQMTPQQHMECVQEVVAQLQGRAESDGMLFVTSSDGIVDRLVIDTSVYVRSSKDESAIQDVSCLILGCIHAMYQDTLHRYLTRFQEFRANPNIFDECKGEFRYPLFEIYVRVPTLGGPREPVDVPRQRRCSYGYVTEAGMYEISITRPWLFREYLERQVAELLRNHQPVVRVRTGYLPIPIHFAIDANAEREILPPVAIPLQEITRHITTLLPVYFDVPKLDQIDDQARGRPTSTIKVPSLEYINRNYFRKLAAERRTGSAQDILEALLEGERKDRERQTDDTLTRDYKIQPLALFHGNRVDYSLGRIKHYTKTSPSSFQNFIVFTNYLMYMDEFLRYTVSLLLLRALEEGAWVANNGAHAAASALKGLLTEFPGLEQALRDARQAVLTLPSDSTGRKLQITAETVLNGLTLVEGPSVPANAMSVSEFLACMRAAARRATFSRPPIQRGATEEERKHYEEMRRQLHAEDETLSRLVRRLLRERSTGYVTDGLLAPKSPQMPAYHWEKPQSAGITIVNIGVGPSNAKTISDHVAVLRPHVFLMLGHCAGLRSTQRLGDYVLVEGYMRLDRVLDDGASTTHDFALASEINDEIKAAFYRVKGIPQPDKGDETMSPPLRMGSVATVLDRNWELTYPDEGRWPFENSSCIAVDMESATIAANGYRLSVPYSSFLCVSDRPLHGDLKMEGMADVFYRDAVAEHFQITISAVEALCEKNREHGVRTRRLRKTWQPAFQ